MKFQTGDTVYAVDDYGVFRGVLISVEKKLTKKKLTKTRLTLQLENFVGYDYYFEEDVFPDLDSAIKGLKDFHWRKIAKKQKSLDDLKLRLAEKYAEQVDRARAEFV